MPGREIELTTNPNLRWGLTYIKPGDWVTAKVIRLNFMNLSPQQLRFVEAIRKPNHQRREIQLRKRFMEIPKAERFDTLLYFFTHSNNYDEQQDCSQFLSVPELDCDRSLEELLELIAPIWNLSVEELPHFLADTFGFERVVDACELLAKKHYQESYERRSLCTIAWWLRARR